MISRPLTGRLFPLSTPPWIKGHGRIEQRSLRTTTALNAHLDFAHVGQACRIERRVTNTGTGETHTERVFCVTDLSPEQAAPERLLALDRGHWSIENRLHWVRDVTFGVSKIYKPRCRSIRPSNLDYGSKEAVGLGALKRTQSVHYLLHPTRRHTQI